jgi:hypothetical protein
VSDLHCDVKLCAVLYPGVRHVDASITYLCSRCLSLHVKLFKLTEPVEYCVRALWPLALHGEHREEGEWRR